MEAGIWLARLVGICRERETGILWDFGVVVAKDGA